MARTLLGWGIHTITFVDSGTVSYSNPGRQCLFEYQDCVDRSNKAVAAANALKRIYPGISSRGINLSIPMPGHPYTSSQPAPPVAAAAAVGAHVVDASEESVVSVLEGLIRSHDAVFLLTDSRESRWLPTVICAAEDKVGYT